MSTGIYGWVEVKKDDKWIAFLPLEEDETNYARFAALAGVHDYSDSNPMKPLGMPADASDTAKYDSEHFGPNGHSHSYMDIEQAAKIFLETMDSPYDWQIEEPVRGFFNIEPEHHDGDIRLVFWFDN